MSRSDRFDFSGPLVVAPLGGGPTTPELVIATCEAGALGSLAASYLSPSQIEQSVNEIKRATPRPFAINLFTPMLPLQVPESQVIRALEGMRPFRQELGIPDPALTEPFHPNFDDQFEAVLRARPKVFSFVFGNLDQTYLKECKKLDIDTIGTATTLEEALALEESGVDAVVAQGVEAGGHRGIFSEQAQDPNIGTLRLTKTLGSKLKIPIIAAGGLMDGADIAKALHAGAQAAMLGTAFLLCPEAGTSQAYRSALLQGGNQPTRLTRAFSGRLARGIENRFMKELDPETILPFPAQNALTRDIRNRATVLGKPEFLSLWAGTGFPKIRPMGAADLVRTLFQELKAAGSNH